MEKQKILNRYSKPEDKLLVSKMLDKIESATSKNKIENTDFLDIYQAHLLEKVLNIEQISNYVINGGIENSERNIIVFYPEKLNDVIKYDYKKILPLTCIRIKLPKEMYNKYNHRDYLGGLIKLGIKREKIGDILVFENGADIVVLNEICKYIVSNISSLTRFSKSEIEIIGIKDIRKKIQRMEEIKIISSSMRLDSIVSELLNTSRGKSEDIINEGRVFVNFENIYKLTKQIKENDIITIRRKGRFQIGKIEGVTKSDRIKINAYKFV